MNIYRHSLYRRSLVLLCPLPSFQLQAQFSALSARWKVWRLPYRSILLHCGVSRPDFHCLCFMISQQGLARRRFFSLVIQPAREPCEFWSESSLHPHTLVHGRVPFTNRELPISI